MKKTVYGIVESQEKAQKIIQELKSNGFQESEISVLHQNMNNDERRSNLKEGVLSHHDYSEETHREIHDPIIHENTTKAPEAAAAGATAGGIIGGTIGLLAGLGSLAIPGLGAFVAAGPIMGALAGSGVGGGVGLLAGALIGMGIPEYEAKRYESSLREGGILLAVEVEENGNTAGRAERAKEILEKFGAKDVTISKGSAAHA